MQLKNIKKYLASNIFWLCLLYIKLNKHPTNMDSVRTPQEILQSFPNSTFCSFLISKQMHNKQKYVF